MSVELSANTIIFTVSAHITFMFHCFLKFYIFSVPNPAVQVLLGLQVIKSELVF